MMPATSKSSSDFETAFEKISELVATFQANETYYFSSEYNEAQVRKDFIDKFLTALGWDVNHHIQKNPYEQEVRVEPAVSGLALAQSGPCPEPWARPKKIFMRWSP
jgi:hypothetical protein